MNKDNIKIVTSETSETSNEIAEAEIVQVYPEGTGEEVVVATTSDQVTDQPTNIPTEEQIKDPDFDLIGNAPEEEQKAFFEEVERQIAALTERNDSVLGFRVRPGSLETFMEWYSTYKLHPDPTLDNQLRQRIEVKPDAEIPTIYVETYSQMETNWIFNHFMEMGLFKLQETQRSPVRFTPMDLRLLYGMECLQEIRDKRGPKIDIARGSMASAGKFNPADLGMKIK